MDLLTRPKSLGISKKGGGVGGVPFSKPWLLEGKLHLQEQKKEKKREGMLHLRKTKKKGGKLFLVFQKP